MAGPGGVVADTVSAEAVFQPNDRIGHVSRNLQVGDRSFNVA